MGSRTRTVPASIIGIVEMAREDWPMRGRCRSARDPDIWYSNNTKERNKAIAICSGCPVKTECQLSALRRQEPYGVWGGIAQGERDREIRARRQVATSRI